MTSKPNPEPTDTKPFDQRLAEFGARYDMSPRFPVDSLKLLVREGYHRRFAPLKAGGHAFPNPQSRYRTMSQNLREIGRGDLSVGRLFEGHVNALFLFECFATSHQLAWLARKLEDGAWLGVWATEASPGVQLKSAMIPSLTGAKTFASGAGDLDFALVTVAENGNTRRLAIVPANSADRTDLSGWRVRGMRASASGRYTLDGMTVPAGMLLGEPGDYDRDPGFTAGAWRFCAVQLGGVEALLAEVRRLMRDEARSDPLQRARFAEAVVAVRTAGFWVAEAARRFARDNDDAVPVARLTRGVVEDAAFRVMEAAARILGTRSAFDGERADKIIRDLSLYLRQAGPDHARDEAAKALLDHDIWFDGDQLW